MDKQITKKFGERVRHLRQHQKMTQELLAEKAECHVNYVGGIERGERNCSLEKAAAICRALGTTISELLRGVR